MGYDILLIGKDGAWMGSASSVWYSSMWEMAGFRSAMAELRMFVPPAEVPDDFDDGYDVDVGAPGIPAFKLKFTTLHRVSAREIGAALMTLDATPDATAIARHLVLEPTPEPGGGPLDVITQLAADFGVNPGPGRPDFGPGARAMAGLDRILPSSCGKRWDPGLLGGRRWQCGDRHAGVENVMNGSNHWRDQGGFEEAMPLTKLFVGKHRRPRPRRVADQSAAVLRAGDLLPSLTTVEAGRLRPILAVEYLALAFARERPQLADWEAAVSQGPAPKS